MEFHRILTHVPDSSWVDGLGSLNSPIVGKGSTIVIDSATASGQLYYVGKGSYIGVSYDPVPWAWAKYPESYTNKFKTVNISIK